MKLSQPFSVSLFLAAATMATAQFDVFIEPDDTAANIVGGSPVASSSTYPGYAFPASGSCSCGASLIRPNILLSAAHCNGIFAGSDMFIGGLDVDGSDGSERIRAIREFVHPDYDSNTEANDIMIIQLASPSSAPVFRVNSSPSVPEEDEPVTVIGFGDTREGGECSRELLQVTVPAVSQESCSRDFAYRNGDIVERVMFCAGERGRDSCQGDSGGPIFAADGSIAGIVSWGIGCATNPGVYTRASAYPAWIEEAIQCVSNNPPATCTSGEAPTGGSGGGGVGGSGGGLFCFSGKATVDVQGQGVTPMDQLVVGDRVRVSNGEYAPVYSFGHKDVEARAKFLQIQGEGMLEPLELTEDHMVFVYTGDSNTQYTTIPAKYVSVGDRLVSEAPEDRMIVVDSIKIVQRRGIYAPFTSTGDIVVNDVLASNYVAIDDARRMPIASWSIQHWMTHALNAPYRMLCDVHGSSCWGGSDDDDTRNGGFPSWVTYQVDLFEWFAEQSTVVQYVWLGLVAFPVLGIVTGLEFVINTLLGGGSLLAWIGIVCLWMFWSTANAMSHRKGSDGKFVVM